MDDLAEKLADVIEEHHEENSDQALAEGAIALAQEQSALAHLQAARTMEEHTAEVNAHKEHIECLTNRLNETETKLSSILSQVENLAAALLLLTPPSSVPEAPTEPIAEVLPVPEVIPVEQPNDAEENPVVKTETKPRRKINRI